MARTEWMIFDYFVEHQQQITWGLLVFIVSLVVSSLLTLFVLLRLPANHFEANAIPTDDPQHPQWRRTLGMIVKNVIGVGLVILGLVMALPGVPGQGLLTMFIGVVLLDFPGKRVFERRIISRPAILRTCNRLRVRFGKPPFTVDSDHYGRTK
jgi:hypothetical protein